MGQTIEVVREIAEEFHRLYSIINSYENEILTLQHMLKVAYCLQHEINYNDVDKDDGYFHDWIESLKVL